MPKQRCSGCGFEDLSGKKMRRHLTGCPEFIELYRTEPAKALDPEAEYLRYHDADETEARDWAKIERRHEIKNKMQAISDRRIERANARWASGVRTYAGTQVPEPEDGQLILKGRTPAQQAVLIKVTQALAVPPEA